MYQIKWDDNLAVGIEKIDDQHKQWIGYFNQASEAITTHQSKEQVAKILGFLLDYTEMHFSTEEKYMQTSSYPGYGDHKAKHDALRSTLNGLVRDFEDEGATQDLADAIETLVGHWLIEHILKVDQKFGAFVAETHTELS